MIERVTVGLIRFLYRLALFPWLTLMRLGHAMGSQVNWLLTGQTFEDVERQNRSQNELKRHFSRS
jgi:hypothetical protein